MTTRSEKLATNLYTNHVESSVEKMTDFNQSPKHPLKNHDLLPKEQIEMCVDAHISVHAVVDQTWESVVLQKHVFHTVKATNPGDSLEITIVTQLESRVKLHI